MIFERRRTAAEKERWSATRRAEIFAFVVLAILIWPVLTVGVVGGYGFVVWMSQIVFGPPGPPH
ncbi:MAG TPA: periplasmic nitrate reductase, NapE protein [Stellaceae bacterium]|jgi:nitrate reductase NapE|nr:periplasmic nitrate reductase, NapE protein [Stellaceae bacterium]